MRRFFKFWWLCARKAFWGNAPFANDWQWVFGSPLASSLAGIAVAAVGAVAPTIAKRLGATEMTTGIIALDSFLGALAAFLLTWLVAYTVRLLNAPVTLFYEQKERADKLDGSSAARPLTAVEKHIAELKERYVSAKPFQRQHLDNLVDGIAALNDVAAIFVTIGKETEGFTKAVTRVIAESRKTGDDFAKRRHVIAKFAGELNSYSDLLADFTVIINHLAPTFLDCTSRFIENTSMESQENRDAANNFRIQVQVNVTNVDKCIPIVIETGTLIHANFKGVSYDLETASERVISTIGGLAKSFEQYKTACELICTQIEGKLQSGQAKKP